MVLTNSATSSPGTALTWLANPSSAWSGWLWLQIQFSVPGLAFSAISQGAVGTVTPLASVCPDDGRPAGDAGASLAVAGTRCFWCGVEAVAPANPAAPSAESCRNWRRSIGRSAEGSERGRRHHPVGGAARSECTRALVHGRGRDEGRGTTYHSCVSWARSLPAPLRRPLSRLVHAAWDGAAELGAIGPDDPRGRRFGRMGAGACLLFPQGALYNEHLIHIGRRRSSARAPPSRRAWRPGQEMPTDPVVSIGSRCLIGRGSHIVGHWEIVIGDDIQTGPYVYITDQNHTYEDPVEPIGRQWPTEAPVRIGSGSWLGANAVILPGAQIGEHVVVAAGAVVRGEVPDRCVVAGVPARVVKRWVEGGAGSTEKDLSLP